MEAVMERPVSQAAQAKPAKRAKQATQGKRTAQTKQTAQVNVRISADLKQRGEAGLAAAGLTPSEGVRMLYEFASRNGRKPGAIEKALSIEDAQAKAQRKVERERRSREFLDGLQPIWDTIHENGWDKHPEASNLSDDELLYEALAEKYGLEE